MKPPERNETDRLRIRGGHCPVQPPPALKPGYELRRVARTNETAEEAIAIAKTKAWWPYVTRTAPYASGRFWVWHVKPGASL